MPKKPLHVLQVTGAMTRGGAEVMLMDIYRNMPPDVRFDFLINTKRDNPKPQGDFDEEILKHGGRLRHIGTQWQLGPFKYISKFKKIIEEIGKPDVVHIHLNSRSGVIALAARLCGIKKVIAHCHGDLVFKGSLLRSLPGIAELKLQRLLVALFATDYWACSQVAASSLFYRRAIRKGNIKIIQNAINVSEFLTVPQSKTNNILETYSIQQEALVIGCIGRIVRRKNVSFVMDVLKVLKERKIDFVFVLAGREDDAEYMFEIRNKVKEYQLEDKFMYLGDRGDIPAVLSTLDVFVSPAFNEAFGMVAIEAQAAGLPSTLSTEFPQAVDVGLDLVTFIKEFDPYRWADAIIQQAGKKCTDKDRIIQQFREKGFDAPENALQIERMYRSV